jgi:ATP-dependent Clp protease ATP-binding subunit ClpX
MYEIPSDPTIEKVTITEDCVRRTAEPILERNPDKPTRRAKIKTGKNEKESATAS